jgi:hypothetical protein
VTIIECGSPSETGSGGIRRRGLPARPQPSPVVVPRYIFAGLGRDITDVTEYRLTFI